MGCGNSKPAATNNNSSSTAGRAESSSKVSEDSVPEDDKWKNYGGVYVGFPADLSNIPQVQIGSLRETDTEEISSPLHTQRARETRRPSGSRCGGTDSNFNEEPGATEE